MPAYQLPLQSSQFMLLTFWFCCWPTEAARGTANTGRYRAAVPPQTGLDFWWGREGWDEKPRGFLEGRAALLPTGVGRPRCSPAHGNTGTPAAAHRSTRAGTPASASPVRTTASSHSTAYVNFARISLFLKKTFQEGYYFFGQRKKGSN